MVPDAMPDVMPEHDRFESCAVVGNSGNLLKTRFGAEIDLHQIVMRFNDVSEPSPANAALPSVPVYVCLCAWRKEGSAWEVERPDADDETPVCIVDGALNPFLAAPCLCYLRLPPSGSRSMWAPRRTTGS